MFLVISGALGGCAVSKGASQGDRYDLGPVVPAQQAPSPPGVPVWLAGVHAPSSLDGTHMLYRLVYSDALQSRAYAQARWSMPVPELLEQRLRQRLASQHPVLNPADGVQGRGPGLVLRIELEDFSQTFSAADQASVRVRLRATLSAWRGGTEQLLDQQTFESQRPCASADAPGGVRALAQASDTVLEALERWLAANAAR
ncbi:ABC-type transport auxiliary lipoprotein family protein [Curvibacter sp. APW13]|uniref:ABC-type transport auxiliary lipoprotein family protein n=1 Tax=Curvibacter sp. APW13 TaxID=3077236 RepID=UPI0028DF3C53|nr:ABC-type transport auxiliary lipoprotein family protein [Curvibacter sp. APW13]MDT8990595.1 ABC-type transport auxiliary lipoprotein family protein [Curvibacter sp. APW13]